MKEILIENENIFDETIKNGVCLVDFYASWCGPCKMLAPFVEEIAEEYEGRVKVCKVDVDEVESLAIRYGIRSIPTLLYFKNNKLEATSLGFQSKDVIKETLDKLLG